MHIAHIVDIFVRKCGGKFGYSFGNNMENVLFHIYVPYVHEFKSKDLLRVIVLYVEIFTVNIETGFTLCPMYITQWVIKIVRRIHVIKFQIKTYYNTN